MILAARYGSVSASFPQGGNAFEAIASQTLASATNTITFSSIPQKYKDLYLVCNTRGVSLDAYYLRFNSDTGSNYASASMAADPTNGTTVWEFNAQTRFQPNNVVLYNVTYYNTLLVDIYSYSQASTYKSAKAVMYSDNANTNSGEGIEYAVGLWKNTNAITTLTISNNFNFASGSVFALYGIGAS